MVKSEHHYQRYLNFIEVLKHQKITGYSEVHHIVPKSLGGSDNASNLIKLTARQHYVAHWMLWKAIGGVAGRSFFMMSNFGKYGKVNSKAYEKAREDYSKQVSEQLTGKPSQNPFSQECREKMRLAKLGKKLTPEHIQNVVATRIGIPLSEAHKAKISQVKSGISTRGSGWKHDMATLEKMSESNRNKPYITCPHCMKIVKDHGGAKRWHFDRCKHRSAAA